MTNGAIPWEAAIGAVAVGLGTSVLVLARDRFPRSARVVLVSGLVVMVAGIGALVWAEPVRSLVIIGMLFVLMYLVSLLEASARWKAQSAAAGNIDGWAETIELVTAMGWVFTDAWVLDMGQVRPPFLSFERYPDGTRLNAVGRHERGGVVTIETFLDDRRGMLVTARKRSSQLRPPWMFRQVVARPIEEMVRIHDEALFRLGVAGIRSAPPFPGSGLDAERYGSRLLRRDITRRWYLWVLRPVVAWFVNRRLPLTDQEDLERQIEGYRRAVGSSAEAL